MLSGCLLLSPGVSLGSVSTSSVLRFREGKVGVQAGIVCLFSQEFQCTAPEELAGVCRSEGNNCSIDLSKTRVPVGRIPLDCAHKGPGRLFTGVCVNDYQP